VVPDTIIENVGAPSDVSLRTMFDVVWNAGGMIRSPFYREGRRIAAR